MLTREAMVSSQKTSNPLDFITGFWQPANNTNWSNQNITSLLDMIWSLQKFI